MASHLNGENFAEPLLSWFGQNARPLPWRIDKTPYRVWVSEVMLQQTRAQAALRRYRLFLDRFPDVASLAAASEGEVLKAWEVMGYYARCRNLHKTAKLILSEHGGELPKAYKDLVSLPGIGPYTASAIASICYGEKVLAVDANVKRAASRVAMAPLPGAAECEALFAPLLKAYGGGDFNEALMELGETACLPKNPQCPSCPVRIACKAYANGVVSEYPQKACKRPKRVEQVTALLITSPKGIALEMRPGKGLLSGMWALPSVAGELGPLDALRLLSSKGLTDAKLTSMRRARHEFTHVIWAIACLQVETSIPSSSFTWATREEIDTAYALPSAFRKLLP